MESFKLLFVEGRDEISFFSTYTNHLAVIEVIIYNSRDKDYFYGSVFQQIVAVSRGRRSVQ